MKNPEKNAVAKLGYTITMVVVASAILICMKKYKDWAKYIYLSKILKMNHITHKPAKPTGKVYLKLLPFLFSLPSYTKL